MPNGAPSLVIDAKFPLEAWNAIRAADGAGARRRSPRRRSAATSKSTSSDIAEKYLISGETQDTAFMFVPSESIFAEIHENFEAIVQKAHRARVVIVSPSLLMLSIQVIQAILKDARMREQAHLIQGEVVAADGGPRRASTSACASCRRISCRPTRISTTSWSRPARSTKRGQKIEALEFGATHGEDEAEARRRLRPEAGRKGRCRDRRLEDRPASAAGGRGTRLRPRPRQAATRFHDFHGFEFRQPVQSRAVPDLFSRDQLFALPRRADPDAVDLRSVADRGRIEMRAAFAAKRLRALGAAVEPS